MKVLTIGGAMVDTIATIASRLIERMKMLNADSSYLLLEEGHKTEADEISTHCGGGAVNAAVAAARLGHATSAIVKLGRDDNGRTICSRMVAEGIDPEWFRYDGHEPTGSSVIISSHDRNAAVFTYRGANTNLEPADFPAAAFDGKDLVYVANLSNQSAERYPLVIERATAAGARIAVNPGIRQLTKHYGDFWDSLPKINMLAVNRNEAEALMPRLLQMVGEGGGMLPPDGDHFVPPLALRGLRNGGYEMTLPKFLRSLMNVGIETVTLTDGGNGAFVASGSDLYYREAETVEAAATTGAGDAFSATFACYAAMSSNVMRSLRAAAINAASVVQFVDTQTGLLRGEDLERRLGPECHDARLHRWTI